MTHKVVSWLQTLNPNLLFNQVFDRRLTPAYHTLQNLFSACAQSVWLCSAKASEQSIRNKLDGRVDTEGYYAVLCIRAGAAESALPQHIILKGQ